MESNKKVGAKRSHDDSRKLPGALPPKRQKNSEQNTGAAAGKLATKTRASKTDFKPLYTEHRKVMERNGLKTEEMIKMRHLIHKNPEPGFKEFLTQITLKEMLLEIGVSPKDIEHCASTGLVVDIQGTGPENSGGNSINTIALRADMDGLPMPENNPDLDYKSQTAFAHMCGHDGHMATVMSTAQVLCKNRSKIPKNKKIRLLFQPAEEGPGGARQMIEEGCLDGVDEVYGYHNIPNFDEGDIRVCEGPIFAACTDVKIKVIGQGGHGSAPHHVRDPITAASALHQSLLSICSRNIDSRNNIVFTICMINSGTTDNVYPDHAVMEGTIRSYDKESLARMKERINTLCHSIAAAFDCEAEVTISSEEEDYPPTVNHKEQAQHVIRLAKKYIGEQHFSQDELPMAAAEDFSYFLEKTPGCFFTLGTMKEGKQLMTLHTANYDYNDDLIPTGAYFFTRIVEDRLGVKILE